MPVRSCTVLASLGGRILLTRSRSGPIAAGHGDRPAPRPAPDQTLVMTPQLRQAIKLLQFSNIEVGRLRRGGAGAQPAAGTRRASATRRRQSGRRRTRSCSAECRAGGCRRGSAAPSILPSEAAAPLDTDDAETYDAGGVADGVRSARPDRRPRRRSWISRPTTAASTTWRTTRRPLRDHLGEQLGCPSPTRWTG